MHPGYPVHNSLSANVNPSRSTPDRLSLKTELIASRYYCLIYLRCKGNLANMVANGKKAFIYLHLIALGSNLVFVVGSCSAILICNISAMIKFQNFLLQTKPIRSI